MQENKQKKISLLLLVLLVFVTVFALSRRFVTKAAPPEITVDTLITNNQSPTITGDISTTTSSVSIIIAGNNYTAINNGDGTWSADVTSTLTDGIYDIVATAIDPVDGTSTDNSTNELTVDTIKPTATINQKVGQADPTNVDSAEFTIVFSEPINDSTFTSSDITLSGTTGTVTTFTKIGTDNTT